MSVISGLVGAKATKSAASTQAAASVASEKLAKEATEFAIKETKRQYDLNRADYEKYFNIAREDTAAERGLKDVSIGKIPGVIDMLRTGEGFERDPGQEFIRSEGEKAIQRSGAAKGNLLSTNQVKRLLEFNQNRASVDYGDYLNRVSSFQLNPLLASAKLGQVGVGATAADRGPQTTSNVPNLLMQGAQQQGNALMMGANAIAGGKIGSANAYSQASSNAVNAYLAYKYITM